MHLSILPTNPHTPIPPCLPASSLFLSVSPFIGGLAVFNCYNCTGNNDLLCSLLFTGHFIIIIFCSIKNTHTLNYAKKLELCSTLYSSYVF